MASDPYLYPRTTILKNKFGIKDQLVLDEMEAEYTSMRLSEIAENFLAGNYDIQHLYDIHRYIFQDIYEWAGEPRTIDIEKAEAVLGGISIDYSPNEEIETALICQIDKMKLIDWTALTTKEAAEAFSQILSQLWLIHPFREGNTRTVTHFCCQYADSVGLSIDQTLFEQNSRFLRNALVAANAKFKDLGDLSKPEHLERIVYDAVMRGQQNE